MRNEQTGQLIVATLTLAGVLRAALRPVAGTPEPRAEAGEISKTNDDREKQP